MNGTPKHILKRRRFKVSVPPFNSCPPIWGRQVSIALVKDRGVIKKINANVTESIAYIANDEEVIGFIDSEETSIGGGTLGIDVGFALAA